MDFPTSFIISPPSMVLWVASDGKTPGATTFTTLGWGFCPDLAGSYLPLTGTFFNANSVAITLVECANLLLLYANYELSESNFPTVVICGDLRISE